MIKWDNRPIDDFPNDPLHLLRVAQLYGSELDILAAAPVRIVDNQIQSDSPLHFVDLSETIREWRSPISIDSVKRQNPVAWSDDKTRILVWAETTRRSPDNRGVIIPRYYVHDLPTGSTWEVWIGGQQRNPYGFVEGNDVGLSGRDDDYPSNGGVWLFSATDGEVRRFNLSVGEFDSCGRSPMYPVRFELCSGGDLLYAAQWQDNGSTDRYPAVALNGLVLIYPQDVENGIHGLSRDAVLLRYCDRNTVWLFRKGKELSISDYLIDQGFIESSEIEKNNLYLLNESPYPIKLRSDGAIVAVLPRLPASVVTSFVGGYLWDRVVFGK
jgi:hypothetical protein